MLGRILYLSKEGTSSEFSRIQGGGKERKRKEKTRGKRRVVLIISSNKRGGEFLLSQVRGGSSWGELSPPSIRGGAVRKPSTLIVVRIGLGSWKDTRKPSRDLGVRSMKGFDRCQ